ncbi:MAG TPA: AAA family ATPase, partial [Sphingomonadales bacterium]
LPARLLSAGQQRRAAIARLLLQPASLWLMDEPTVGLDARSLDDLTRLMAEHVEAGGAIMVATHQPLDLPSMQDLDLSAFRPEEAFT